MTGNDPNLEHPVNINAYKIWWNFIHLFLRYWAETKFWYKSRAITAINLRKMTVNNPSLDLVNINAYQSLVKIYLFILKILSGNKMSIKGHYSVTNKRKLISKNPNLDLFNINVYTKFGKILSFYSQDIEQKRNSDVNQGPSLCYKCVENGA